MVSCAVIVLCVVCVVVPVLSFLVVLVLFFLSIALFSFFLLSPYPARIPQKIEPRFPAVSCGRGSMIRRGPAIDLTCTQAEGGTRVLSASETVI